MNSEQSADASIFIKPGNVSNYNSKSKPITKTYSGKINTKCKSGKQIFRKSLMISFLFFFLSFSIFLSKNL